MKFNPQRPLNTRYNEIQRERAKREDALRREREQIFQRERKAAIDVHVPGQAGINPGPAQPNPPVTLSSKKKSGDNTKA